MNKLWSRIAAEQKQIVEAHLNQIPVPVAKLARELGLDVKLADLGPKISGEIRPTGDGKYVIRVNRFENSERQRFTIAHEIAHYLLHKEHIGDGLTDNILYRSELTNGLEREANRLAADLLMPADQVRDQAAVVDAEETDVTKALARRFNVSSSAMEIRLGQI